MLRQKNRIPRRDFASIIELGKFYQSANFTLRTVFEGNVARFAVSVSKKVAKSAVVRNSLRRRVYAVVWDIIPNLSNGLYFISAKRGADKIKGNTLSKEISNLLKPFERR